MELSPRGHGMAQPLDLLLVLHLPSVDPRSRWQPAAVIGPKSVALPRISYEVTPIDLLPEFPSHLHINPPSSSEPAKGTSAYPLHYGLFYVSDTSGDLLVKEYHNLHM